MNNNDDNDILCLETNISRQPFSSTLNISPSKPKYLYKLLNFRNTNDLDNDEIYKDFLLLADISLRNMKNHDINISSKFDTSLSINKSKPNGNESLNTIFMFYARLTQDLKVTSFTAHDLANETMDSAELLIFCRDFNIIPKILTREDILNIWKGVLRDRKNDIKAFIALDFIDFVDVLVKISICACNKGELKKYIEIENSGQMLEPFEQIVFFAQFLQLDDYNYVLNQIKTVGRASQGNLHFRSFDDKDLLREQDNQEKKELLQRKFAKKKKKIKKFQSPPPKNLPDNYLSTTTTNSIKNKFTEEDDDASSVGSMDDYILSQTPGSPEEQKEVENGSSFDDIVLKRDYNESFKNYLLSKYNYIPPKSEYESFSSIGPFIDMGTLPVGCKVVIKMKIKNTSTNNMRLDVIIKDLQSNNVTTTASPGTLISGFSFITTISFTVEEGCKSVLGNVDIYNLDSRRFEIYKFSCPIFYRVSASSHALCINNRKDYCSVESLPSLLRQKCGIMYDQTKSFEVSTSTYHSLIKSNYSTKKSSLGYEEKLTSPIKSPIKHSSGPLLHALGKNSSFGSCKLQIGAGTISKSPVKSPFKSTTLTSPKSSLSTISSTQSVMKSLSSSTSFDTTFDRTKNQILTTSPIIFSSQSRSPIRLED
jgi:hypothetical protein